MTYQDLIDQAIKMVANSNNPQAPRNLEETTHAIKRMAPRRRMTTTERREYRAACLCEADKQAEPSVPDLSAQVDVRGIVRGLYNTINSIK